MRLLWNTVSFLAVVHLLALLGVAGWLWQTGRLTPDRIESIRSMLSQTASEEEAARLAAEEAAEKQAQEAFETDRTENPPPPSSVQVRYTDRLEQATRDRMRRLETEIREVRSQLDRERTAFAIERDSFEQERKKWESERNQLAEQTRDAQFKRVVTMLESMPSKQAKDTLVGMMNDGKADEAALYVNAMKSYSSTKVMKEFKTDAEKRLAMELLQRIRALGSIPDATEASPNADTASPTG